MTAAMAEAVKLLKEKLGILTDDRDEYLGKLLHISLEEVKRINGLSLDEGMLAPPFLDYVTDLAVWKYKEHGDGDRPRWLRQQLRELMIKEGLNGS